MIDNKLTPRQNELISEALCHSAIRMCSDSGAPDRLMMLRRALVDELKAVTTETSLPPALGGARSIDG